MRTYGFVANINFTTKHNRDIRLAEILSLLIILIQIYQMLIVLINYEIQKMSLWNYLLIILLLI